MLKDFEDDDQSNSGIARFSKLVMCISRLTIFTSSLSFYLKKNLGAFIMKIKKQIWKLYLNHLRLVEIRVAESKQNQFDSDS